MPLFILGINHNTAPVEIREKVVFEPAETPRLLTELKSQPGLAECMVLSTCNRTEIIANGDNTAVPAIREWLRKSLSLEPAVIDALFELREQDAAKHIFRVASGLDSVILGEPQIAGQLKEAYRTAIENGTAGAVLDRVCQSAFSAAKRVRTTTAIGENPVSVAYAVVSLAERLLDRFDRHTAVLVGAGETIDLVARHLHSSGIGRIFVANRSVDNAHRIAHRYGGFGLALSELDGTLPEADILVTSTASPNPIISHAQMENAIRQRRRRPVFVADIAVPRDIEASVTELNDIYMYTVDDLQGVITENLAARHDAAVDAEQIIEDAVRQYGDAQRTLNAVPLIKRLRGQSEELKNEVLEAARRKLESDGPDAAMEYLAHTLVNKMMHKPSSALRRAAANSETGVIESARKLFGIDETDEQ